MWKAKYKMKMKAVCVILTLAFVILCGTAMSKVGVLAMNQNDYTVSRKNADKVRDDKAVYEMILGDIYDSRGVPVMVSDAVIAESEPVYHKSYSHLLGSVALNDSSLLNSNYETLTARDSGDAVPNKGRSISLTINDDLQRFAYSLTEGQRASVAVLRRGSGELLALTSTYEEDFDLGQTLDDDTLNEYNTAYEPVWIPEYLNSYAPGSCQKMFSSAVAYEYDMDGYKYDDEGSIDYGDAKIYNSGCAAYGNDLDITRAFCVSANTYFASLFNKMEIGKIRKTAVGFLLNGSVDTDFGTVSSRFSFGEYTAFDIGLLAIGQKNELSSVGLAMLCQGVIDNEIYRPHVIKNTCVTDKNGDLKEISRTKEEVIAKDMISNSTSSDVRKLMETAAHSEGYLMSDNILGAKSGTAEVTINGTKTDRASLIAYNDEYIAVISKIESGAFGISNKAAMEKLFNILDDISGGA